MRRVIVATLATSVLVPVLAGAVPTLREPRLHPKDIAEHPSFVQRVEPAIVGLHVRVDDDRPSARTLGTRRFASAVVFDARGYALTVSYAVLDAASVRASLRSGRSVTARVVGIDFDSGLGVVKLDGDGPWPVARLGESREVAVGALTGTVGSDDDGDLVHVTGSVQAIRPFAAYWEYMLERAFIIAPSSPAWGGSAVVDTRGDVIAIASLRLGDAPHVNLAIPLERFLPVKDELVNLGRVVSKPPRPWLGLYTLAIQNSVVIDGFSPSGPARSAGFRKGDRIVGVNGVEVRAQEEFYEQLWRATAGDVIHIAVVRDEARQVIAVRSVDRRQVYRTTDQ